MMGGIHRVELRLARGWSNGGDWMEVVLTLCGI